MRTMVTAPTQSYDSQAAGQITGAVPDS